MDSFVTGEDMSFELSDYDFGDEEELILDGIWCPLSTLTTFPFHNPAQRSMFPGIPLWSAPLKPWSSLTRALMQLTTEDAASCAQSKRPESSESNLGIRPIAVFNPTDSTT